MQPRSPLTVTSPEGVLVQGIEAGTIAALLSGIPSTVHSLATRRDPLEATRAAGKILLPHEDRTTRLVAAALPLHLGLSWGWGVVLAATLPRRHTVLWSAAAGILIAALDLGVFGRRFPAIAALPLMPQVADHVAFGATVGAVLERRRSRGPAR